MYFWANCMAVVSPCKTELDNGTTRLHPQATRNATPVAFSLEKIAVPNGPPVLWSTFIALRSTATCIISSSVMNVLSFCCASYLCSQSGRVMTTDLVTREPVCHHVRLMIDQTIVATTKTSNIHTHIPSSVVPILERHSSQDRSSSRRNEHGRGGQPVRGTLGHGSCLFVAQLLVQRRAMKCSSSLDSGRSRPAGAIENGTRCWTGNINSFTRNPS